MGDVSSITYEDMRNVTPSDTLKVPGNIAAGFGADVAGTIKFTTMGGSTNTRTILAGIIYDIAVTQIFATSTTATGIYCVYGGPLYKMRPSV